VKLQPSLTLSALAAVLAAGALVVAILAATVFDDSGRSGVPSASAPSPQTGEPIPRPDPNVRTLMLTVVSNLPKGGAGEYSGWVEEIGVADAERHPDDASGTACVQAPPPPPGRATCTWRYLPQAGSPHPAVWLRAWVPEGSVVSWTGCSEVSTAWCKRFLDGPSNSVKATIGPPPPKG
jgi:hypothetical protein